jgi:hypothetical protein
VGGVGTEWDAASPTVIKVPNNTRAAIVGVNGGSYTNTIGIELGYTEVLLNGVRATDNHCYYSDWGAAASRMGIIKVVENDLISINYTNNNPLGSSTRLVIRWIV